VFELSVLSACVGEELLWQAVVIMYFGFVESVRCCVWIVSCEENGGIIGTLRGVKMWKKVLHIRLI
jgi:hypothetical protein